MYIKKFQTSISTHTVWNYIYRRITISVTFNGIQWKWHSYNYKEREQCEMAEKIKLVTLIVGVYFYVPLIYRTLQHLELYACNERMSCHNDKLAYVLTQNACILYKGDMHAFYYDIIFWHCRNTVSYKLVCINT